MSRQLKFQQTHGYGIIDRLFSFKTLQILKLGCSAWDLLDLSLFSEKNAMLTLACFELKTRYRETYVTNRTFYLRLNDLRLNVNATIIDKLSSY